MLVSNIELNFTEYSTITAPLPVGTTRWSIRETSTDNYQGQLIGSFGEKIDVAKDLIQYKKVQNRARIGITYSEINAAISRKTGLPIGILIGSVDVSSNLSSQGVAKNDVITEVNGKAVTSQDILLDVIDVSKAGDEITLKIFNSTTNNYKTVKAKLLLDESVSSYSTEAIQTTTSVFPNIF